MAGEKILIIDDDEGILEALEMVLTDAGYEVSTLTKDEEALRQQLQKSLPDLIILDVFLSGADGREISTKLKNQNRTRNIPIIMISAHPTAQKSIREAGADDFIPKPFDIDTLLSKVSYMFTRQARK